MKTASLITVASVVLTSTAVLAAWGIYDPVTMQQVSKSAGAKTCSGIADVAGAVTVVLRNNAGAEKDRGDGTAADSPPYNPWSAVLDHPNDWDLGNSTVQLLDSNDNVKHQTHPVIVQ
jgi:hypothetical protein